MRLGLGIRVCDGIAGIRVFPAGKGCRPWLVDLFDCLWVWDLNRCLINVCVWVRAYSFFLRGS